MLGRRDRRHGVEHAHDDVGLGDREVDLPLDPLPHGIIALGVEPARVDEREAPSPRGDVAVVAIAGHPGLVVHDRDALADQPVEQRALAGVGPPDQRDDPGRRGRRRRIGRGVLGGRDDLLGQVRCELLPVLRRLVTDRLGESTALARSGSAAFLRSPALLPGAAALFPGAAAPLRGAAALFPSGSALAGAAALFPGAAAPLPETAAPLPGSDGAPLLGGVALLRRPPASGSSLAALVRSGKGWLCRAHEVSPLL